MPAEGPAALLWDFDGTLVDSVESWYAAEVRLMAEWGHSWSREQASQLTGLGLDEYARVLLAAAGRDGDVAFYADVLHDYALEHMRAHGIAERPGAFDLVRRASGAGLPCAVVSATYQRVLRAVVDDVAPGAFVAFVGGDDVTRTKPDPEPYQKAAALLGVDPRECLAIEDSQAGTTSALAAGCVTLVVPDKQTPHAAPRAVFRGTLEGLTLDDVRQIWRDHRHA